jgi:hypothetical protein
MRLRAPRAQTRRRSHGDAACRGPCARGSSLRTAACRALLAPARWAAPCALVVALLCPGAGWTQDAYLRDEVLVHLRASPSDGAAIVRTLRSGQRLDEVERARGWSRVTTPDGAAGWLPSQYLVSEPPASVRLAEALRELARAREALETLRAERAVPVSTDEVAALQARLAALETENARLAAALGGAEPAPVASTSGTSARVVTRATPRGADYMIGAAIAFAGILLGALWPRGARGGFATRRRIKL